MTDGKHTTYHEHDVQLHVVSVCIILCKRGVWGMAKTINQPYTEVSEDYPCFGQIGHTFSPDLGLQ